MQLTGRAFDEATLVRVADAYERDTAWWSERPEILILTSRDPEILRSEILRFMTDPEWATWTDEQLLATRLCDLKVSIAGTEVEQYIAQVNGELEAGLVRPHYWLSDEWFTPDGVPGVAVPSRPPAAGEARARADARGRRRRSGEL